MLHHQRRRADVANEQPITMPSPPPSPPSTDRAAPSRPAPTGAPWIVLAVASGACAAVNGAFAKLTTTGLTSHLARSLATLVGLSSAAAQTVEFVLRAVFFALNLTFNGVMWTLFTKALARGLSTTQVSIINTSTNFVLTALLGLAIFSEALPPLWWAGAALLFVGNVIVGRKDEAASDALHPDPPSREQDAVAVAATEAGERKPLLSGTAARRAPTPDEDVPHLGDLADILGR